MVLYLGPLRLSPYRILLIFLFVPLFFRWISGGMGKIHTPDVLMLLFVIWSILAIVVNNGVERAIEPGGIIIIETFGTYLVARCYIRNVTNFKAMVNMLLWLILCLFPFAIYETLTGNAIILQFFSKFMTTFPQVHMEARVGLHRSQVVFEHPILYGVFCGSAFGVVYFVSGFKQSLFKKFGAMGVVVASTVFSVSTGALVTIIAQQFLISWAYVMRNTPKRWKILAQIIVSMYVLIDLLSNRTPFHVFVTYLTFSVGSSYNRILIWDYGTAEVARHPIFGIGLNDWVRPTWMSASMDNFWLATAVLNGLPGFMLFTGAVFLIMRGIGRADFQNEELQACRRGVLLSLGGLVIAGCTAFYWNATYCWFIFMIGSGVWMLESDVDPESDTQKSDSPEAESGQKLRSRRRISKKHS